MTIFKTGLKVSLISALVLVSSITTTARADHDSHSILPYVALGVFATMLHQNSHSYRYTTKRRIRHSSHNGHSNHFGQGGHNGSHYKHRQHSHSSGGYSHKQKRH